MASKIAPKPGATTAVPTRSLSTYHRNARRGDVSLIKASLLAHGQYKPVVANIGTHTGRPHEVLAGNHTLMAARDLAEEGNGDFTNILVHWVDVDDDMATRIVLADNRTAEQGSYDYDALLSLVESLDGDLDGIGFSEDDIDHLAHLAGRDDADEATNDDYAEGDKAAPQKREMPLDLIFTGAPSDVLGLLAFRLGWEPGCISTSLSSVKRYLEHTPNPKRMAFIDNEWHGYDHKVHLEAVEYAKPKYATIRDVLTKQQAADAGVTFYTLDQTVRMGEDVAEFADHVIVIPKFDCLADLPREINGKPVVLGYSVRSSYGGTELPPSAFAGWPVHLLGGSWKDQRAILNILGDDVVSMDNNMVLKSGTFGGFFQGDGSGGQIDDLLGYSSFTMAVAASLSNIAHYITHEYGVELNDAADTPEGPSRD